MKMIPHFINPFCTTMQYIPDDIKHEPVTITLGGCLTEEDERPFYSKEEWEKRKGVCR